MDIEKLKEQLISDPEVMRLIAHRAFEIYLERRDRYAAHPAQDWLRAESEILPRLINKMVERNRRAIEAKNDADPVSSRAAEHMREETSRPEARKPASRKSPAKPAVKKAAAKPAAKKATEAPATKKAAAKPVARKAAKPAASPAEKEVSESKAAPKAKAKKPATRPKKTDAGK